MDEAVLEERPNALSKSTSLIAVIDDDRLLVQSIIGLLESLGYAAVGFASAEDFLNSPDLLRSACLILDVRMPSMSGLELQRRLRCENNRTPIIFMARITGRRLFS